MAFFQYNLGKLVPETKKHPKFLKINSKRFCFCLPMDIGRLMIVS